MEIELLEGPITELTLPERAAVALGSSAHEVELRKLVMSSADIVAVVDPAGREQAHRVGMNLKNARTTISKVGKAAREDAQAFSKAVIAEESRLIGIVEQEESRVFKLRDDFDAKLEAEKQAKIAAERTRVEKITADIQWIKGLSSKLFDKSSADIAHAIKDMKAMEISEQRFAEFTGKAKEERALTIEALQSLHDRAIAHEAFQARIEQEREAEAARLAAERAENERVRKELEDQRIEQERIAEEAAREAAATLKAARDAQAAELSNERAEQARLQAIRDAELEATLAQQRAEHEANQERLRLELAEVARERAEIAEARRAKDEAEAAEREKIAQAEAKVIEDARVDAIHAADDVGVLDAADDFQDFPEELFFKRDSSGMEWDDTRTYEDDVVYVRSDIVTKKLAEMLAEINEINKIG